TGDGAGGDAGVVAVRRGTGGEMTVQELPTALRNLSIPVTARLRPNKTNGLYVIFPNGVIVSMVWRPGSYSDNHDMWVDLDDPQAILRRLDSRTVEVGIF